MLVACSPGAAVFQSHGVLIAFGDWWGLVEIEEDGWGLMENYCDFRRVGICCPVCSGILALTVTGLWAKGKGKEPITYEETGH